MDRLKNTFNFDVNSASNGIAIEIFAGIVICLIIYVFFAIIRTILNRMKNSSNDAPVIFAGLVDADKPRVAVQDPNHNNPITLYRSKNEQGIEYTYSVWLYIDGSTWGKKTDNKKSWSHVFHKGPKIKSIPKRQPDLPPHKLMDIQCPGLWISPVDNTLRLCVNTFKTNIEYLEVSNIPIKKWVLFTYTQSNFTTNIYINGRLKATRNLESLPRQNYYDLYVTEQGGFKGYLSNMRYWNFVLKPTNIYDLAAKGPNLQKQIDEYSKESSEPHLNSNLPYLSNRWWVDDITIN